MRGAALLLAGACVCSCDSPSAAAKKSASPSASAAAAPVQKKETAAPSASAAPKAPGAVRKLPALNVVLILIDSMRWDMPWNGYNRPIAPFLTRFEGETVSYLRGYALSSSTSKSVLPMLSGKYPSEMRRGGYFFTYWFPENLSLPEMLGDNMPSLGVFSHAYFFPATGVTQGFTQAHTLPNTVLNNKSTDNVTSERITDATMRLLRSPKYADQSDGKRFFAYVHYMDPHAPYLHHEDRPVWGTQPRDYYDQELHYTDEHVERLVSWIQKQPFGKHTAIIISADHGESFGEHGHLKHGYEVWEELVRVPWMFWFPGVQPRRIATPRGHIDMCRTILDLMGRDAPSGVRGRSLVQELLGTDAPARPVVVDLPRDNLQDRRRAIIDGDDKLLVAGDDKRFLLFNVEKDPREKKNLAATDQETKERMLRLHRQIEAEVPVAEVRGDEPPLRNAPEGRRY